MNFASNLDTVSMASASEEVRRRGGCSRRAPSNRFGSTRFGSTNARVIRHLNAFTPRYGTITNSPLALESRSARVSSSQSFAVGPTFV